MKYLKLTSVMMLALFVLWHISPGLAEQLPLFKETTSASQLQDSGPATGDTITIFYKSGDPIAGTEAAFAQVFARKPELKRSIRTYAVNVSHDDDPNSKNITTPFAIMTVRGSDSASTLRTTSRRDGGIKTSEEAESFIAEGRKNSKYPPAVESRVVLINAKSDLRFMYGKRNVLLTFDSRSFVALAEFWEFQAASSKFNADCNWVALDISALPEDDQFRQSIAGKLPKMVMHELIKQEGAWWYTHYLQEVRTDFISHQQIEEWVRAGLERSILPRLDSESSFNNMIMPIAAASGEDPVNLRDLR